jgi:hypothetical protein
MKLGKPVYNAKDKVYTCDITDGFRFKTRRDEKQLATSFTQYEKDNKELLTKTFVSLTQGWFSKPLTEEYVISRICFNIPTESIEDSFEGVLEWVCIRVIITKESFMFVYELVLKKEDEKVVIDFAEEEEEVDISGIPVVSEETIGIGPTRQYLDKKKVLSLRLKAARCLFQAERATQRYGELYGEDTDWEDEDEEDDDL